MTDGPERPQDELDPERAASVIEEEASTPAARLWVSQRAGGVVTPIFTALLAFLAGGLIVLGTGKNPITTYKAIFLGTGLDWPFRLLTGQNTTLAALNLQQMLLLTTPLILTGLAVAFAFRCGLFNIGGQGQYIVGSIMSVWIASSLPDMPGLLRIVLAIAAGALMGAVWAGIAGFLKATVGAHEVITTIMLNWVAYWGGSYLFGLGGALQSSTQKSVPVSNDILESSKLRVFWGDPQLQGLHVGFFIALVALVSFWLILSRTTLGYEVRAVGFNPEAARYGGISIRRNYFLAMAISGMFAGLAGAVDVLGWEFRINVNDIQVSTIGFIGIAVALLGRNTALGTFLGALLFGALVSGTSTRHLDPSVFRPELANNLTLMIQGLVVLFIGADLLIIYLWRVRTRLRF
jgi:simple sugar transport system permease protein